MYKILFPTDFSKNAQSAFEYTCKIANIINSPIEVVHYFHPAPIEFDSSGVVNIEMEKIHKERLKKFVEEHGSSAKASGSQILEIKKSFMVGFAGSDLVRRSQSEEDLFIVMGSTGSGNSLKKIFGSVSAEVAKKAVCPTLIVPPKSVFNGIKNIVYACDDKKIDIDIMDTMSNFAKLFGADLHMVHVNTLDDKIINVESKQTTSKTNVIVHHVKNDSIADGLNKFVEENDIDMIGMSTYDRGFFGDLFHKSVTKEMAINTNIPLLILHSK